MDAAVEAYVLRERLSTAKENRRVHAWFQGVRNMLWVSRGA